MYEAYRSIRGVRLTLLPPLKPLRKIEQPIFQPEAHECGEGLPSIDRKRAGRMTGLWLLVLSDVWTRAQTLP